MNTKQSSFPLCTPEDLEGTKSRFFFVYLHIQQITGEWELQVCFFLESQ